MITFAVLHGGGGGVASNMSSSESSAAISPCGDPDPILDAPALLALEFMVCHGQGQTGTAFLMTDKSLVHHGGPIRCFQHWE